LAMTVSAGCTPAEAAHAAAKAQEFMQRHSLSLFDVESKTYGETVTSADFELPGVRVPQWSWRMAHAVCQASDCDFYLTWTFRGGKRVNKMRFIGHTSDCQVASYLYDTLSKRLWAMSAEDARANGRTGAKLAKFRWDFMFGAADAIYQRLVREQKEFAQTAQQSSAGAMVVVKKGAVKEWIAKNAPNLTTHRSNRNDNEYDYAALHAGAAAGRSIDIRQGIAKGAEQVSAARPQLQ